MGVCCGRCGETLGEFSCGGGGLFFSGTDKALAASVECLNGDVLTLDGEGDRDVLRFFGMGRALTDVLFFFSS